MKKRSQKKEDVEKLKGDLANVSTVILTTFQGITVAEDNAAAPRRAGRRRHTIKW